jgi:hypothetical protein
MRIHHRGHGEHRETKIKPESTAPDPRPTRKIGVWGTHQSTERPASEGGRYKGGRNPRRPASEGGPYMSYPAFFRRGGVG